MIKVHIVYWILTGPLHFYLWLPPGHCTDIDIFPTAVLFSRGNEWRQPRHHQPKTVEHQRSHGDYITFFKVTLLF